MEVIVFDSYEAMSRYAAKQIEATVRLNPEAVLGLATGSTPIGTYQELIRLHREEDLDFSLVETVNLDEYIGLPEGHEQSYKTFMREQLFDHINVDPEACHIPNGQAEDFAEAAQDYEDLIDDLGGIDLQILGLGPNGHIGFNEPAEAFANETHVVQLTAATREANARFFASEAEVPKAALTMGIGTIMRAERILLLVSGEGKKDALEKLLFGPVCPQLPASILQFHPDVTVLLDRSASIFEE